MGMNGYITVNKSNGKRKLFDNYKLRGNVTYILKIDSEAGFSNLSIDFYLNGGYGSGYYATVCIPKAKYCYQESFEYDDEEDGWYLTIDVKINDLYLDDAKADEITVYIFTKKE